MNEKVYQHERTRPKVIPTWPTFLPERHIDQAPMVYLDGRGLDAPLAIENGWYVSLSAGDEYTRIVIPATNTKSYIYWQARAVDPAVYKRYRSPKYAAGDSIIVVWPRETGRYVAIVEGPLDALAAAEHGLVGVSVMGKQPPTEVFDHIEALFPSQSFVVLPDGDGLGGVADILQQLAKRRRPATVVLTGHKDLAAMPREQRRRLLDGFTNHNLDRPYAEACKGPEEAEPSRSEYRAGRPV